MQLPFRDGCVDVCYSSNVLEHVPDPWRMADEMLRVTRPGGIVFVSYTVWFGPWGGHETAPWHYLGGRARPAPLPPRGTATSRRTSTASPCSPSPCAPAWPGRGSQRRRTSSTCCRATTRGGRSWLLRVPLLREVVTWNLVIVLRKR